MMLFSRFQLYQVVTLTALVGLGSLLTLKFCSTESKLLAFNRKILRRISRQFTSILVSKLDLSQSPYTKLYCSIKMKLKKPDYIF